MPPRRRPSADSPTAPSETSEAHGETRKDAAAALLQQKQRRQARQVTGLMLGSALRMLGVNIRQIAEAEIWLRACKPLLTFPLLEPAAWLTTVALGPRCPDKGDYAAQVAAQSLLESTASAFGFILNPLAGTLSDALGRKPVMLVSPIFMCVSCALSTRYPTVWMVAVRRFLMPLSSTPWHTGERAALADMFKEDGTAYALAQSRIATMRDATSIGVPIIGGWLAMRDVRLPWLVATVIHLFQVVICMRCLEETLPEEERVPFRWRSSSPLGWLKLFRRGRKLRLVAINSCWASLSGRYSTWRYDQVHRQQMLDWDLNERGWYDSFSGIFEVCGSFASGRIIQAIGTTKSLYVGYASAMLCAPSRLSSPRRRTCSSGCCCCCAGSSC